MPPEAHVLAFDTSAAHCAAALVSGDRVVAERVEEMATGQADRLIPLLEEMLAGAGLTWQDLSCLAVGTGPGNFTGVRIAVAAARGLALGLGIPAVGVTALEALAHGTTGPRLALLDARRDAVYAQLFEGGSAAICTLDSLPQVPPGVTCLGHLAAEAAAKLGGRVAEPAFSGAVAMARIALTRADNAPRPAPFYLRGADAAPPSDPPPVILP